MSETNRQPYPGLIMPAFRNANVDPDQLRTMQLDITVAFADGTTSRIAPDRLVNTPVHSTRIVRNNFYQGLDEDGDRVWTAAPSHLEIALNGWDRGAAPRRSVARAYDPRTIAWLRERLAWLFPDATASAVTFTWTRQIRELPGDTLVDTERVAQVEVPL